MGGIGHNNYVKGLIFILVLLFISMLLAAVPVEKAEAAGPYVVTGSVAGGTGGDIVLPENANNVPEGSTTWVTFDPAPGYFVQSVKDSSVSGTVVDTGESRAIPNPYPIVNINSDHAVEVAFTKYGTDQYHFYKSTVDGATLPCSVYKPEPKTGVATVPLWVNLHPFGGEGVITPVTDTKCILSPWGRNNRSLFTDNIVANNLITNAPEPNIFDDFSSSAENWVPYIGNSWSHNSTDKKYQQTDASASWKAAYRSGSLGADYTISVDLKELSRDQTESAIGVLFRMQGNYDCYLVDLDNNNGAIYLRLWRYQNGGFTCLAYDPLTFTPNANGSGMQQYTENDPFWKNGVNLKVSVFDDAFEVKVNNRIHNIDLYGNYAKRSLATCVWLEGWFPATLYDDTNALCISDEAFSSGFVGVASFGGVHQFDNFRMQDESLFGETDVTDCINQFINEVNNDPDMEYKIDPKRIYLSGFSMGGGGTWTVGTHYPDLFSGIHPANGSTDLENVTDWIAANYYDTDDVFNCWYFYPFGFYFKANQDMMINETVNSFVRERDVQNTGDPDYVIYQSVMHGNSARYVIENLQNMPIRIHHPEYDSLVPNSTNGDFSIFWSTFAPVNSTRTYAAKTNQAPQYANAKYVWDKLQITGMRNPSCQTETSGYDEDGNPPPENPDLNDPYGPSLSNLWDSYNYSLSFQFGNHSEASISPNFTESQSKVNSFWDRASNAQNIEIKKNPPSVAYKTYDNKHNKAWWLTMEIPNPDQNDPGLARVINGKKMENPYEGAEIHVKNVKTTTLDLTRMGIATTPVDATELIFTLDNNTSPEAELVTDSCKKTTLKLVGTWFPEKKDDIDGYHVIKGDSTDITSNCTFTGTTLTVNDTDISSDLSNQVIIKVQIPGGLSSDNLLAASNPASDPGFESGFETANWMVSDFTGSAFTEDKSAASGSDDNEYAHSGNKSACIANSSNNNAPYIVAGRSGLISGISTSKTYNACAFVKTRSLSGVLRTFLDGKYDPGVNAAAGVGIAWYDGDDFLRLDTSTGVSGNNEWIPVELINAVPPSNADGARVVVYTQSPNNAGSTGSAWFDDVSFMEGSP